MRKRILAIIMSLCMILTLLPLTGFAVGSKNVANGVYNGDVWEKCGNGTLAYTALDGTKLSLSKTAKETGCNTFEVNLKVVAESTEVIAPPCAAATVLVIDNSLSMSCCSICGQYYCFHCAQTRMDAAKAAALDFIEGYKGTVPFAGRYVAVVKFSDNACVALDWVDVSTAAGYNAAVSAINNISVACIGTNLDDGLYYAKYLLSSPIVCNCFKYVIALSDGAPNYSRQNGDGCNGSCAIVSDTAATAACLRSIASVYTVCVSDPFASAYCGGPTAGEFLGCYIATPSYGMFNYAYTAATVDMLNNAFAAISQSIVYNIGSSGEGLSVVDPMGEYVSVVSAPEQFTAGENGYTWVLESVEPKTKNVFGVTKYEYTYSLSYTVKLDADAPGFDECVYHPLNMPTFLKWNCCECFAFPVPAVKGHTSRFTVVFNNGENGDLAGQDKAGNVTYPYLKMWTLTPAAPEVTPDAGYSFTCWLPEIAAQVTGDAKYVAQYAPNEDTAYKIEYYLEQLDGSFDLMKTVDKTGVTDTLAEISADDELSFTGFALDKSVEGTVLSGNIAGDGSLTLKLFYVRNEYGYSIEYYYDGVCDDTKTETGTAKYATVIESYTDKVIPGYALTKTENMPLTVCADDNVAKVFYDKRTDLGYTVNYLWNGTDVPVAPSAAVNNQVFGSTVTEEPVEVAGYTAVNAEPQSIVIDVENNVINFYYYKNVTLTANSADAVYDGTEHSVAGFEGAPEDADFSAVTVGASATVVGSYPAEFAEDTVGTVDATAKYIVSEAVDGMLTILPIEDEIVITAGSASKAYDGKALTESAFTYTEGVLLEGDVLTAVVEGTQTDAGSSENAVVFYKVMRGDLDVTGCYTFGECVPGTLSVTKANVVLTSATASKTYDGKALASETVKAEGFAEGEGAVYSDFASITEVGSTENTFKYALNENTKADNYNITVVNGTLTVAPLGTVVVTITEHSGSFTYDGSEKTVSGYDVSISDPLYKEADFSFGGSAEVKGTVAGSYEMQLKAEDFANTNANFENVKFVIVDGELVIKPIETEIVITAKSSEKAYDGKALTDAGFSITEGVLAEGDVLTAVVEGSQTDAGTSANKVVSFKVMRGDIDVTACYKFADSVDGMLTVLPAAVTLTSGSASKDYDGKKLVCEEVKAEGFVEGEGASFSDFASITEVGKADNTFKYALNENTKAENYEITVVNGTLTVNATTVPKTGDDSHLALWAVLALLSACTMAYTVLKRKGDSNT